MKEKRMNYKSKRNVIIGLIAVVVAAAAIAGTVAFVKGNESSKAAMEQGNIQNIETADSNNNSQTNKNEATENQNGENSVEPNIENRETQNNSEQEGRTNEQERTNSYTPGETNNRESSSNRNRTNRPEREYTQTTIIPNGGDERLVSEDEKIGWSPITVSAKTATADINVIRPDLEIHKLSYINNDSVNDEPIHSTVQKNDTITYVIQVINHGEVEAKNVNIYDVIPEGTKLIEGSISNNGICSSGRISWKMDVPAKNEESPVEVSFKVKVLLEDSEGKQITLIDNQAIVDGEPTETTHNPAVTAVKKVNVVANDGSLLENQTVVPGTRLRYTVVLTNSTDYDGISKVVDKIPDGTSIVDNSISEGGELKDGVITWEVVNVPANSEVEVYFDVTVNKDTRKTVRNVAKIGNNDEPPVPEEPENPENPENPDEPTEPDIPYTNEVRTPVFVASKTSLLDGQKVRETNTVEYVVKVKNVGNPEIEKENIAGTAKLNDRYWIQDTEKMTFEKGTMVITDKDGNEVSTIDVDEEFLKNIEVTLNAGETATITYTATVNVRENELPDEGIVVDEIANNLYWAKSEEPQDPSRPENPNDPSSPANPENPDDPTKPTPDPDDEDEEEPIDTVIVEVEEEYIKIEASKIWIDDNNKYKTRPENVTFRLFRGYDLKEQEDMEVSVTLSEENNWKAIFTKLKKTDVEGKEYVYTVREDEVKNYETTYSQDTLTVKNKYTNPIVSATKKVEVVKEANSRILTTSDFGPNAIVEPGTRLRYTIVLTNETKVDAYVKVEDTVPAGTTLYKERNISDSGTFKNGKITWNNIKVPAATDTEVGTASVHFDVTVNKNQKETVSNFALVKIPTIPDEPEDPENPITPEDTEITTPEVKTPVFIASKKSVSDYNSQTSSPKLHETNDVTYVVTITNSANPADEKVSSLTGTAKLEDKFWIKDSNKMTYKSGNLVIKDANGRVKSTESKQENFLNNIEVTLGAGESATLTYVYTINTINEEDKQTSTSNKITYEWDEISNNLYWAESTLGEPSRPIDVTDGTDYKNTDPDDPTPAAEDPDNPNKEGLIDTVIIHVEEEYIDIEASKVWDDKNNEYKDRPDAVNFTLYRNGTTTGKTLSPSRINNWKVKFEHLRRTDANGRAYSYTIKEQAIAHYVAPAASYPVGSDNTVTITNLYGPNFIASKTSEQNGDTLEETEIINYVVTVSNTGRAAGTIRLRDVYRNNDSSKVTFVPGSIKINGVATTNTEAFLSNMEFTLNANEAKTISYQYKINVMDKNNMTHDTTTDKYTTTITNDLFWGQSDEPEKYPTDEPIDTVTVNVEKKFVSIPVTKQWVDSNDANKQRPAKIALILQDFASNANGVDVTPRQEKILTVSNVNGTNANEWVTEFTDLPKYNSDGKVAKYGVREEGIVVENGSEVRKSFVRNYQTSYEDEHKKVVNTYSQDLKGTVTITNVTTSDVPLDVVFVLDISGSMFAKSDGTYIYTADSTDASKTPNRLSNMIKAVNEEIKTIRTNNPDSKIGIELFNSHASTLLNLSKPTPNSAGNYITFKNQTITLSSGKTFKVPSVNDDYYKSGTYTQSGVFEATKNLFSAAATNSSKVTGRIPVLILLTDGDPTHYDTNVSNVNVEPPNKIYENDTKSIGRVRYCTAEDYACTMKTISLCKSWITNKYSNRDCKLYTISIDMHGSMAKALLNPTSTNTSKLNNIDPATSDVYSEIYNASEDKPPYKTPHATRSIKITGEDLAYYKADNNLKKRLVELNDSYYLLNANYYVWQQMRLYNMLKGITTKNNGARNTYGQSFKLDTNYTDKTFTSSMSAADMQSAFRAAIELSSETTSNISLDESNARRINLTNIDSNKQFKISISAVNVNGNTININKTFATFTAARSDSTVSPYIKQSGTTYYLDFSNLRQGTINVTYGKQ